jgi:hypothetical protein
MSSYFKRLIGRETPEERSRREAEAAKKEADELAKKAKAAQDKVDQMEKKKRESPENTQRVAHWFAVG